MAYKSAFTNMHKSLIDISATNFKNLEEYDPFMSFAKPTEVSNKSEESVTKRPG